VGVLLMDNLYFLKGLKTFDLRDLYKEVKKELKFRGQFHDNKINGSVTLVPKHYTTNNKKVENAKESRGVIFNQRNNDNAGFYDPPKKWNSQRSILIDFLKEDWRFLFPNVDDTKKDYYVYYHVNPNTDKFCCQKSFDEGDILLRFAGTPFYIGKGKGKRYKRSSGRSTSHVNLLNTYYESGYEPDDICKILQEGLTELEALELESKLITYFGCYTETIPMKKHFTGFSNGTLINSDVGKRPFWILDLIRFQCGIIKTI